VQNSGIELVIKAMRAHTNSTHIQQYACQTIANIGWTNGMEQTHARTHARTHNSRPLNDSMLTGA
jgi:hypothetical protein